MTVRKNAFALMLGSTLLAATAQATVKDGVDAWSRGDYARALKEWRSPAIAGDADAQFNMGQAYKLGRGVAVDLKLAEDWYRKAATQGHIQAEDNLGLVMFQNGDRQKAMPYVVKSAERGDARAQYVYGTALFNGDMVKKDWPRAYGFMTRASAAGIAPASASLAQMDKYIPLDQRQKGLALARDLEDRARKPIMVASAEPPRKRPAAEPLRKAELPPSKPSGSVYEIAETKPAAKPKAKPAMAARNPQIAKPVAVAAAAGGKWRVQLGAFGDSAKARALWNGLEKRVGALGPMQPYLVQAGSITRLQAGPLASRAAAEKLCDSVRAAGNACLPVG
jgi:uncharacterized protein